MNGAIMDKKTIYRMHLKNNNKFKNKKRRISWTKLQKKADKLID